MTNALRRAGQRPASGVRQECGGPGISPARFAIVLIAVLGCSAGANSRDSEETMEQRPSIEQVLQRRTPELMRIDGVEGVGQAVCDSQPCIRVYIRDEAARSRLPRQLEGFAVSTVVTGPVRARTNE